jgi:VWFA-related protein
MRSSLSSAISLTALLVTPVAAQEEPRATFEEKVAVELVNVEVWVSDRDERPVTGLTAADFEILHDGKPVSISHFNEVRAGVSITPPPEAPQGSDAPLGDSVPPADGDAPENHLILYFDQLRMHPSSYRTLQPELERFLASKAVPAERVLILRQARGLFVEARFGSSLDQLESALERVARTGAEGLVEANDAQIALDAVQQLWEESDGTAGAARNALSSVPDGSGGPGGGGGSPRATVGGGTFGGGLGPDTCDIFLDRTEPIIASWSREQGQRVAFTVSNLSAAAAYLAGLPGVKTLLYMSDGLATRPGDALVTYVTGLCPAKRSDLVSRELTEELSRSFLSLTRHANTNRVTIHAIQASGLRGSSTGGVASRGSLGQGQRPGAGTSFDSTKRHGERQGMVVLAEETGGRAVFNRGDLLSELERIAEEMGTYYSLAYHPPEQGRGDEHRIDVRLGDSSLEVRHRRGFVEKDTEQWMSERLDGVLSLGLASNPLEVRLGAGETRAASTKSQVTLPLHVMVPVESLAFLDAAATERTARLELRVLARDHETGNLVAEERSFHVRQPEGRAAGLIDLALELTLDRGTHTVAVGLRDSASGQASFVASTLEL